MSTIPLTTDMYRTGSPNFFIRGSHKLLHKNAWAEHLTYWDCFGICYILPNQKVFRQLIFHFRQKYLRAGFDPRTAVWTPCYRRDWSEGRWPLSFSSSNLDHIICPDLLLVIEARRYELTSFSLPVVQPRILLGRDLSMTSSVIDVVLRPTVPSFIC